jgi:hypothetical protein
LFLGIAAYLGIGLFVGNYIYKDLEKIVIKYENGYSLSDVEMSVIDELDKVNKVVSGKIVVAVIYIIFSVLWLPIYARELIKKKR